MEFFKRKVEKKTKWIIFFIILFISLFQFVGLYATQKEDTQMDNKAQVYFTTDISEEGVMKL